MCSEPAKLALGFMIVLLTAAGIAADDFTLDWWTTDGGGDMWTTGGDFELSGTVGQPDANTVVVAGGDFELTGGFWVEAVVLPPCPGDLDGDDDTDQSDLGILLASWAIDAGGDLDGDGDTDQGDLGILLADWGCGT
jgi:hypothetical protein